MKRLQELLRLRKRFIKSLRRGARIGNENQDIEKKTAKWERKERLVITLKKDTLGLS